MSDSPCPLCGLPRKSARHSRCESCAKLVEQAANAGSKRRVPIGPASAEAAIREAVARRQLFMPHLHAGYLCAYSLVLLETDKELHTQGDYASFDHTVPNTAERAVLCTRIVNDLKGWMTDGEFRKFICEVLDPAAPRRLHGRSEEVSREYLIALREVMQAPAGEPADAALRERLKVLSAGFAY